MKKFYSAKLAVILLAILSGWNVNPVIAQCNCSWSYKMPVIVRNLGSTALVNYQVSITVNTAALISAGQMEASGNDILFASNTGCVTLPYYIMPGTINTTSTVIWINVNSIPASANDTINMFYGNSTVSAPASNGNTTFILFDDFLTGTLDATKWVYAGSDAMSISGGVATITGSSFGEIESISSYANQPQAGGYLTEIYVNSATGAWPSLAQSNDNAYNTGSCLFLNSSTMYFGQTGNVGGTGYEGYLDNSTAAGSLTGIWSVVRTPSSGTLCTWPGGTYTFTSTNATTSSNQYTGFGPLDGGTASMAVDWIRCRQYYPAGTAQTLGTAVANGALPITGATTVCTGLTTALSDPGAGIWTSGNTAVATVGSTTGIVTGVTTGTAKISYSFGACLPSTLVMTVKASPVAIVGASGVCTGFITALSDATSGGTWSSSNTAIATISSGGSVTGITPGTTTISYTNSLGGCSAIRSETVNLSPSVYTVSRAGSGVMCIGGVGFHITLSGSDAGVSYQLYCAGIPVPAGSGGVQDGTGASLDFDAQTGAGAYKVIATNTTTSCGITMSGSPSITVNPNPAPFAVTISGGGSYCYGGTGLNIQLTNSVAGINYKLYDGALLIDSMAGSGSGLSYGLQTDSGTYNIVGTSASTGCSGNMSNTVHEAINPLPNIYAVSGGGDYCAGSPGGKDITLSGSDAGATYELINGGVHTGTTLAGTGSAITFHAVTASGAYTINATNATSCNATMGGSVGITIDPLPNAYPISPNATYCSGSSGADISLSLSNTGISYQLYNTGGPVGSSILGSGGSLDFGIWPAGSYYIIGNNNVTHCANNMTGTSVIGISAPPITYLVTGGGPYCMGGSGRLVGLNGSDATSSYQLYLNGAVVPGATLPGTGSALSYGYKTDSGSYTIMATATAAPNCTSLMNGSGYVTINPLPFAYTLTTLSGSAAYCAGTTAPTLILNGSDAGIQYQLYYNGVATGPTFNGNGSPITFGVFPAAGTYSVGALNLSTSCTGNMANDVIISVNPLPAASAVTGGGSYCVGGAGKDVILSFSSSGVNYQLYRNGMVVAGGLLPGSGGSIDFGTDTTTGVYTVVGTNSITGCTNVMTGSASINTLPLPAVYAVSGGGGYCAGGLGSDIMLSASNTGVNYQLYNGTIAIGGTVYGTGHVLDFGKQPLAGTYMVVATNPGTSCSNNMADSANVTVNLPPNIYTVSGGGNYCAGGVGKDIYLPVSDNGVNYQLYLGSAPAGHFVTGAGSAVDFGTKSATGIYTVIAINGTTGCTSNMSGSAIINVSPLPDAFTITGGGSMCAGDTGLHIDLNSSAVGNIYQLYNSGVAVAGASVAGTGGALDFGAQTAAGVYTIKAMNTTTSCSAVMSSHVAVTVNPVPNSYMVSGGGGYCAGGTGVDVSLANSDLGITYQLYDGSAPVGYVSPGMRAPIDFGLYAVPGIYTVIAKNPATGCMAVMDTSATISVIAWVTPAVSINSDMGTTECAGISTTFTANPVNGGVAPAYTWYVNGVPVAGIDSSYNYVPNNLDEVSVKMTSNAPCPSPATIINALRMNVNPLGMPAVSVTADPALSVCQGTSVTFTAAPVFGGVAPVYYWSLHGAVVDSGIRYSYLPVNGDVVSLMMIGNYPCNAGSDTVNNTAAMTVQSATTPVFKLTSSSPAANLSLGQTDTIKATLTSGGPATSYQWVLNTTPLAGETTNMLVRSNFFNKDSVTCIVTGSGTCGSDPSDQHIVLTVKNTTGINSMTASGIDIRVVPNPNRGVFTIRGTLGTTGDQEASLEITNMLGQSVYHSTVMAHGGMINEQVQLNNLANGMYLLNVVSDGEKDVFHFVIEQ